MKVKSLSRVQLLATPWTAAHQVPPSMGFSRQEYWSGVPLPSLPFSLTFFKLSECMKLYCRANFMYHLIASEQLHFHFSLSCTGEGNGNPLQCSCLENPRDGEPGGLPSMGVTQSWTRLKQHSSSSSIGRTNLH